MLVLGENSQTLYSVGSSGVILMVALDVGLGTRKENGTNWLLLLQVQRHLNWECAFRLWLPLLL